MAEATQDRLGIEAFQVLFDRCSNWGRWGPDDERGTLNLIAPEQRIRAASLVREGVTVSCAHPINTVGDAENTSPANHFVVRGGDVADGVNFTSTGDHLAVSPHGLAHSHLDALCHFFWQGKMYNGHPIAMVTSIGARANAITIGEDGIVSRGILLDVARQLGVDWLETDHSITVDELEACEAAAGLRVESGESCWFELGATPDARHSAPGTAEPNWPGLDHEVAPWLKERGVALLGCDGVSDLRQHAFVGTGLVHPMHVLTLVAMGMQLLDNQNLDDLAAACAERSRWEFMLVVAPLRLVGGTASMTNPIAIF